MKTSDITPQYIHKIAEDGDAIVAAMTKDSLETSELELWRILTDNAYASEPSPELNKARERVAGETINSMICKTKDPSLVSAVFARVKENLSENELYYNDYKIVKKIIAIAERKTSEGSSELELVRKCLKTIKKLPTDERPNIKDIGIKALEDFTDDYIA